MDDHERRVQEFHLNHPLLSIRSDPMIKDAKREPEHWSWIMISCWWNAPLLSDFVRSRSLWQTDDGISRGGGGRNVFRHFCDYERFSLFLFFFLDLEIFFFLQIGWINCSGMTRFNLWTIVSFRFVLIRIGDRRVFLKMYIAEGRKIAFGFVDGTDFLCCNIVITRISVLNRLNLCLYARKNSVDG